MSAYVVVTVDIHDPIGFADYRRLGITTLAKYGARVLARDDTAAALEGTWPAGRVVILEFDSIDTAKAWHASPEYQAARVARLYCANTNSIYVDGV